MSNQKTDLNSQLMVSYLLPIQYGHAADFIHTKLSVIDPYQIAFLSAAINSDMRCQAAGIWTKTSRT